MTIGLGVALASAAGFTLYAMHEEKNRDPRARQVRELLHEARVLLARGKRRAQVARRATTGQKNR